MPDKLRHIPNTPPSLSAEASQQHLEALMSMGAETREDIEAEAQAEEEYSDQMEIICCILDEQCTAEEREEILHALHLVWVEEFDT